MSPPCTILSRQRFFKLTLDGRSPNTLLVFRALQVGDLLCAVPALRALRTAYPEAHIALVGLPWARDFVRRFDRYVDEFIEFPGDAGLPEQIPQTEKIPAFFDRLRRRRFDAAIQMHGSGQVVNDIVQRMGARVNAGYYERPVDCLDRQRFMRYPGGLPEVRRHLALMNFLGIPSAGEALEFPLRPEDLASFNAVAREHQLSPGTYVCVHPGARARARRWRPERFAAIADESARAGWRVVLTGSPEERELTEWVAMRMAAPSVNVAGPMSLGTLAALISRARLLLCNDTGVSHVAAALRVPSVVIFTGSDPARWAPLDPLKHRPVFAAVDCRPCSFMDCPIGHPCAVQVETATVIERVKGVLQNEMAYAI